MTAALTSAVLDALIPIFFSGGPLQYNIYIIGSRGILFGFWMSSFLLGYSMECSFNNKCWDFVFCFSSFWINYWCLSKHCENISNASIANPRLREREGEQNKKYIIQKNSSPNLSSIQNVVFSIITFNSPWTNRLRICLKYTSRKATLTFASDPLVASVKQYAAIFSPDASYMQQIIVW